MFHFNISLQDFKMYGGRLFLSLESLKLLFHSREDNFLDDLVETIESEGMEQC